LAANKTNIELLASPLFSRFIRKPCRERDGVDWVFCLQGAIGPKPLYEKCPDEEALSQFP
jgi:hypothetical protein